MTTQVSFVTDEELKNKALERAKEEGLTLKAVLVYAMKGFVEGKIKFSVVSAEESEVEEIHFDNEEIQAKAKKLAKLLA